MVILMNDPMWEENTDDLFEEITEAEALSDSIYKMYPRFLSKMWAQAKVFEETPWKLAMRKYPKLVPGTTIQFRRYYAGADLSTEDIFEGESNKRELEREKLAKELDFMARVNSKMYTEATESDKEKVVRESECEAADPLGTSGKIRRYVPCLIPELADSKSKHAKARLEAKEISHGNGPAFPEG